jgi:phenylpropionate dioxygenase-like ring-hydroxylating dioxygenase large terminal subunit
MPTNLDLGSYRVGFSLPQHLYTDDAQYRRDEVWLKDHLWFFVDHESRIPNAGDFFLYEYANESVIVIRDRDGQVRAHYNVCRHRGSRICTLPSGNAQALICPYHAWTYGLDGRLRTARYMQPEFSREQHGLVPCQVRVHCGLIFISLADPAPDFATFIAGISGELEFHDIAHASIAHRWVIPAAANWKLVVENNLECYHCRSAHPTYWSAHPGTLGPGSDADVLSDAARHSNVEVDGSATRTLKALDESPGGTYQRLGVRRVLGGKFVSESVGGTPVAPLMGKATYDGFQTQFMFSPLTTCIMNPDYTILYNFIPRSVRRTDIEAIWLVNAAAFQGKAFEVARVIAVWDTTLREDKVLLENNQLGVESDVYRPGPYSSWEGAANEFDRRYITHVLGQAR